MSNTLTEVCLPLPHSIVVTANMSLQITRSTNIVEQVMIYAYTSRDYDNVNSNKDPDKQMLLTSVCPGKKCFIHECM